MLTMRTTRTHDCHIPARPARRTPGTFAVACAACAALLLALAACRTAPPAAVGPPTLVATTTMLEDLARQIAEPDYRVVGILRPGVDPHLYQPAPSDARAVASSTVVLRNGLHLEGWLDDLIANAGGERAIIEAGAAVAPLTDPLGAIDPHVWFDGRRWAAVARHVGEALASLPDADAGEGPDELRARAAAVASRIEGVDGWARACLETVPATSRVLVTSHDAFRYFGEAYGFEVVGIQGVSTQQEASHRDVARVIGIVRERSLPAIFVETSVNRALAEQVGAQTGARLAGPLYSDAVGEPGSGAETWEGMMVANVQMIAAALGGSCPPPPAAPVAP